MYVCFIYLRGAGIKFATQAYTLTRINQYEPHGLGAHIVYRPSAACCVGHHQHACRTLVSHPHQFPLTLGSGAIIHSGQHGSS